MDVDSKELLQRYVREVWDEGNPDAVRGFLAEGYRRHVSPTAAPLDVDAQVERVRGFRTAFPDVRLSVENIVAEGDRVVLHATMRGTHAGPLLGIAPTGREVTVGLVDLMRVADGRIIEHWGGPDLFDLLRQLGATVVPPD